MFGDLNQRLRSMLGTQSVPQVGDFVRVGNYTFEARAGRMVVKEPASNSSIGGAQCNIASIPYTIELEGHVAGGHSDTGSGIYLALYIGDGTKYINFLWGASATSVVYYIERYTSPTSSATTIAHAPVSIPSDTFKMRIVNDGSNRFFMVGQNGKDWATVYKEPANTYLTENKVMISPHGSLSNYETIASIYNFKITYGVLGDDP